MSIRCCCFRKTGFLIGAAVILGQFLVLQNTFAQNSEPNLVTAIEQVAKQSIPAVVHVEMTEQQEVANPFYEYRNNPFFRQFFDLPHKMPKKFERKIMGLGSGIIIDEQGHIVTNNHVVANATKLKVTMSDGQEFSDKDVQLVGTDPLTDLAVLKVNSKKPLPFLKFGNSDDLQVGQWVVAIGQPQGLSESVTQGIISAKHRRGITNPESYQDFLQTDAPINPGNSGGPLLNLQGEVVGVNSAIFSTSGGFQGIGFAIPSNMATHITQQLMAHGKVTRGWIGVMIQNLTRDIAKSFHVEPDSGVLVADVVKGGPADKAGIKRGDIITSFNGTQVKDGAELRNQVANTAIGEEVPVQVLRDGKTQDLRIKIENQQEELKVLSASLKKRLGIDVQSLTPQERDRYGIEGSEGVVISWVDPKGALGKAGFEVGDVILKIDGQPIEDATEFAGIMDALPHHTKVVFLAVDHRTGQSGFITVHIP